MQTIPDISFKQSEKPMEFEVLHLKELLARIPTIKDHNPSYPHRIKFFALLIITNGEGTHQIDLKEYQIKAGSVLKIAKGQVHAFQDKATYDGYLIIFTENFILNYFSKSATLLISLLYNYHIHPPISEAKELNKEFLDQLLPEVNQDNKFAQKNIVSALLELYLLKLKRNSLGQHEPNILPKHYHTFIQFKNLVESKYTETRNVLDYAQLMSISAKHLNHIVKEFTLNTAKTFIDDYVILEAKRDMVISDKSIKEVAFGCGFDEVTNFTKFFKKKMGISPKQYQSKQ
jgi:AraC-like DNA-binding protein/quercetin dioxygenase-like cupin family protein